MRLKNKVVLITGSYTGIGKAIAQMVVKEGGKVILNGLDHELGMELVKELGTENALAITIDITTPDAPSLLIKKALEAYKKIDVLINNAATIASSNLETTDSTFLKNILEVNTIAPLAIIRAATEELSKSGGCVLNIGSINAWGGEPDLLAYSISKGALMTLTRNLGDSLFREKGVRVNQINPGWVLTDNEKNIKSQQGMKDDWYKELPSIFAPSKRLFKPEEIAAAACLLISDDCGPLSAQIFDWEQFPMIGRNLPKTWNGSHN
ncbi:SDR family oxidoreductase [uncultured Arcticibacterium sp.]|uniref:SDR family NAD(P)-dependent oxidoreductase n=1 Tax=uncultured Arcticibacterium sp. TaxID=2173042 RepID=UPI0030F5F177